MADRVGLKEIAVSGIWLRRDGDHVEVLAENPDGDFILLIREYLDSQFSHIIEPAGICERFNKVPRG